MSIYDVRCPACDVPVLGKVQVVIRNRKPKVPRECPHCRTQVELDTTPGELGEFSLVRTLKRGQVPHDELVRVEKAHDVRTLCPCAGCSGFGNEDRMIKHGASWFHGRCFVSTVGEKAFFALPQPQTDRLTFGDLGTSLMQKLIARRAA